MIYAVCLQWGILPPGFKSKSHLCWDKLSNCKRAKLIGFYQTYEHELCEKIKLGLPARL